MPPVGQWILLVTLAGACLGYPLLLWLDPLAVFTAVFGWAGAEPDPAVRWAAFALPVVLLLSLILPHAWCHRLCPLGALQELLDRMSIRRRGHGSSTNEADSSERGTTVARRFVLFSLVGLAWAATVRWKRSAAAAPLRPPGAVDERQFTGVCVRCGNCIRACPAEIIRASGTEQGLAGWLAPILCFEDDYCHEDCTACTEACPTGALLPVEIAEKRTAVIGFPRVDMDLCLLGDARDCAACRTHCPFEAVHFRFDEETYLLTPVIDPERCPGCGACQVACPTQPVRAIVVEPLG
jgi:ferredoxin-type protein NapF